MIENNHLIGVFLSASVPLRIRELQSQGGPTEEDMLKIKEHAKLLGEHGDAFLFKSKKKGLTAQVANAVAASIAILSFVPGGITLFDQHWESTVPKETCDE